MERLEGVSGLGAWLGFGGLRVEGFRVERLWVFVAVARWDSMSGLPLSSPNSCLTSSSTNTK